MFNKIILELILLTGFLIGCSTPNVANVLKNSERTMAAVKSTLMNFSVIADLQSLPRAKDDCDIWTPFSFECRAASSAACERQGFVGGYGPVEYEKTIATVFCISEADGRKLQFPANGECPVKNLGSAACEKLADKLCIQSGAMGSVGIIGRKDNQLSTLCLHNPQVVKMESANSFAQLQTINKDSTTCTLPEVLNGNGCQNAAHRWCRAKGYGTGFDLREAGPGAVSIECMRGSATAAGLQRSTSFDAFETPAKVGFMRLGGAAFAGDITYADVIFNDGTQPLLITEMNSFSSYVNRARGTYSKDMCFYLNRGVTFQADENDDGEVACTYSEEFDIPPVRFQNSGLLLRPGERLGFQGTPQWGSKGHGVNGEGLYAGAIVKIEPLSSGKIPLRRIRFPQWDTAYEVKKNKPTHIPAGCVDNTCAAAPAVVPSGKEKRNSNWIYAAKKATTVRGISIFMSSSLTPQVQSFNGCLKFWPPGVNRATTRGQDAWCFQTKDEFFGPSTFRRTFGNQDGSSLVPLNLKVPAGSTLGFEFEIGSEVTGTLDFGSYVWLEENPA